MQVTVNPLHLTATTLHAELMAKHGMGLTRNAPTLRRAVEIYALDAYSGRPVRSWKEAAVLLREIKTMIDENWNPA